ncbi:hypothetical protein SVAN01_04954 [Stagonosporopsis vannaccii]|nr:hypothetical protein SVAN01_04954 [Stagonosporopsis vannaccii]
MTTAEAITRELAQYLDRACAKGISMSTQRKHFKEKLQQLQPLRGEARAADIEGLYNVGAWYLLFGYPPKFPSFGDAADARLFARSRHIVALTSLKTAWKRPDTISQIRTVARDVIPFPTWPGRDFIDKLFKIAGAGYPLKQFLEDLPRLLHARLDTVLQPKYFKRESQRCVIPLELDEFYRTLVEPWIVASQVRPSSRKRRKTDVNGQSTTAEEGELAEIDELTGIEEPSEIEQPRRLDGERVEEEDLESSPATRRISSVRQRDESPELDAQIEESELPVDDDLGTNGDLEIFNDPETSDALQLDYNPRLQLDYDPRLQLQGQQTPRPAMAPRKANGPRAIREEQARKEVDAAFQDLDNLEGPSANSSSLDTSAPIRWVLSNGRQRHTLRQQIESTKAALSVANAAVTQLEATIAATLPTSTSLIDAIAAAQKELDEFTTHYAEDLAALNAQKARAEKQRAKGWRTFLRIEIDETDATAQREELESQVSRLEALQAELDKQRNVQAEKSDDLDKLEESFAEAEEAYVRVIRAFGCAKDELGCATIARRYAERES